MGLFVVRRPVDRNPQEENRTAASAALPLGVGNVLPAKLCGADIGRICKAAAQYSKHFHYHTHVRTHTCMLVVLLTIRR